jgi:transcriptional regulator with XRE-family HTH domain
VTFQDAQLRLLAYVRDRIQNGEFTERGFARMLGISQPHVHNVLKGARNFSADMSDSILNVLHISILDLVEQDGLEARLDHPKTVVHVSEIPFLDAPIGPGVPWPAMIDRLRRFATPFPALAAPSKLIMARLAYDPEMDITLAGYDSAILDISERERLKPAPEGLYAVERNGGILLRYLRPGGRGYYLVTDMALETPEKWEHLSISGRDLPGFIQGRVLWLGRENDRGLPMHQRGRFLYDVMSS